ncbi:MAG TPA: response regulator [Ramlibacter sp.]|nr:response regulator [Ramlibacter sp.]
MANVLIIEDDDSQRFVARFALKKAGHTVEEAADGPQGVAAAQAGKPDVIVCDVMMPGMSGYEVVGALRNDPALANVPVILLTAMTDRKHMRQGMTAGADDYLTKPYRPDELCEAIDAVLARRQVQHDAFMNSMSGVVSDALEQQKEQLGRQYENQLVREINARWSRANTATDVAYQRAFLLLADLFGPQPAQPAASLPELVKQAQQSARDTLYLFGANHILPYGTHLMAVFSGDEATLTTPVETRMLRAAAALLKGAPRERPATIALHCGPVTMVALSDGLHGDQGHSLVPGDSIAAVSSVLDTAAANRWRMAATPAMAGVLVPLVTPGRRAATRRGEIAVELLPPKP